MPRQISEAYFHGKEWLTSTTGAPLRAAYNFLFPPLDDLFVDDASTSHAMEWRNASPQGAVYERSRRTSASSAPTVREQEALEQLDVWDSFSDSPWSFITSRYTITLIIVAIINNRVQHICRPRGGGTSRLSQLQRIALRLPSLVMLARIVLIFTTIVADAFLSPQNPINAVLRRCTTTSWRNAWLGNTPMSGWALDRFGASSRDALLRARDATALWAAFTSTCVAVISDTIVRNLDADRQEPPAFNLVGFAFLLHFHSFSPDAPANEHVYLCVLLQMLQILAIALSRCRRPVYVPRLVVSGFFGITSLLHYALVANSGRYPFLEALSRTPEIALVLVVLLTVFLHALTMLVLEGGIQPHRLLFSRSNLPSLDEDWGIALFKLGTACMESTRLTGLEREVEPLVAWEVPYIELSPSGRIELVDPLSRRSSVSHPRRDASSQIEIGDFSGFSREVKEIRIDPSAHSSSSSTFGHAGLARVRAMVQFVVATLLVLRNIAVIMFRKVLHMIGLPDPSVPQWVFRAVRFVRLVWHGRNGEARRRERQAAEARRRRAREELQQRYRERSSHAAPPSAQSRQLQTLSEVTSVRSLLGFRRLYGAEAISPEPRPPEGRPSDGGAGSLLGSQRSGDLGRMALGVGQGPGTEVAGEEVDSDDGDEDYDLGWAESELRSGSDEDDPDLGSAEEFEMEVGEVSGLLEDLGSFAEGESAGQTATASQLTVRSGTASFNQLLLAHLTRPRQQAPLTRSGYNSLIRLSTSAIEEESSPCHSPSSMAQADLRLAETLIEKRNQSRSTGYNPSPSDEARRLCVVCCTEERNVICWPCRCLCLCMECREHLASQPPARRSLVNNPDNNPSPRTEPVHLCPTCRTPVQAFSRLYIP